MLATAVAVLGTACAEDDGAGGGDPEARAALEEATANLAEVQSAVVDLRLVAAPRGDDEIRVGFELRGPIAAAGDDPLTARLEYTQLAGREQDSATFIAVDGAQYVELDGQAYELTGGDEGPLGDAADAGGSPLAELDVASWISEPERTGGEGGTERISGPLDVVAAYTSIAAVAGLPPLEGPEADRLRAASSSSTAEIVLTAGDEPQVRSVRAEVVVGPEAPDALPAVARGATILLELTLEGIGESVEVEAPADARPFESIPDADGGTTPDD